MYKTNLILLISLQILVKSSVSNIVFDLPYKLNKHLGDAMPRQKSLSLIPREEEDFQRGDKHFKHVPPPTYIICLSPKDLYR